MVKHRLLELANLTTGAVGSLPCSQQPATASYPELKYSTLSPPASQAFLPSSYQVWGSNPFAIFFFSLCCQINRSGEIFALFFMLRSVNWQLPRFRHNQSLLGLIGFPGTSATTILHSVNIPEEPVFTHHTDKSNLLVYMVWILFCSFIMNKSTVMFNLLKPNDIYIYMSYRSANLQTLHFKYLFNKYTY